MRPTAVYRDGQWMPTDVVTPNGVSTRPKPAPRLHVISDNLDGVVHPCDGRHYHSKSRFRQATRYFGCDEVGNDPEGLRPNKPIERPSVAEVAQDMKRAIEELRSR